MTADLRRPPADPAVLDAIEAFTGLEPAARQAVLAAAQRRPIAAGAEVFGQGEPARSFFVLVRGRLRVAKLTPEGQQMTVRYLGPGESFGCVAVCGGLTYPAGAAAVEDSEVLAWTRAQTQELAGRFPRIALNVIRIMGGRIEDMQTRLGEATHERVERRIARALTRLAAQAGRRQAEGVAIDFPLSRQDLAEYAGTTLSTVSRTLSRWEEDGIVALGRRRVVIRRPHALVTVADDLQG
jgi:CRP-like cAMP-binding protein